MEFTIALAMFTVLVLAWVMLPASPKEQVTHVETAAVSTTQSA